MTKSLGLSLAINGIWDLADPSPLAANASNIWPKMVKGQVGNASSSANNTLHTLTRANCSNFSRVRLTVMNSDTSAFDLAGMKVAVTTDASDPITPSTSTWVPVTFGGDATPTIAAGTADRPNIVQSDWVDLDSVAASDGLKPFIMARGYVSNAATQNFAVINHGQEGSANQAINIYEYNYMRSWYKSGNHVTTTTGFTSADTANTTGSCMIIAWEFESTETCVTFMNIGDSIASGQGSAIYGLYNYGWFQRVMKWLSADGTTVGAHKINWMNAAWPGQTSDNYSLYAQDLIDAFMPSALMYDVYTPNDGTLDATIRGQQKTRADSVATHCDSNNVYFIPTFLTPSNNWSSAENSEHDTLVADITASYAQTIDMTASISDGSSPENMQEDYYADSVHPGDRGYYAMARSCETQLRSLFDWSSTLYSHFDPDARLAHWLHDEGITLNGSDVSQWDDATGNGYHWVQTTAAYQPVWNTSKRRPEFNSAAYEGFDMITGKLDFLRNKERIFCFMEMTADSSGAADWVFWASIGTSTSNYRFAVQTQFGLQRLYWRRADADTGVSINSVGSYSSGVPFIYEGHLTFVNGDAFQDSCIEQGHVQANDASPASHVNTGATSDTDSLSVHLGTSSNRFAGSLDGLIGEVAFTSDPVGWRDYMNDKFGRYNKASYG